VVARPTSGSASGRPADDDGSLDALLGMVDLGGADAPPSTPKNPALSALVEAASEPAGEIDRAAATRVADGLADRLRQTLTAVVEHPDVRRAEAAWRGLKMLVDRLAFRHGARLTVLAAPKASLAEAVHFQVLLPEYEAGASRTPLAAVLLDHAVEATSGDLNVLGDLAASGASLQVPVVLSASPAFFGLDGPTGFSKMPPAQHLLQQPEYAAFRSLRTRGEAAHLALAVPPFLLRHAYGTDHPDKAHGVEGGERLWGGAAILVGVALAEAHRQRGWPTGSAGQAVGDLVVRTTRMGAMPLAAAFSDAVLDDLARAGILAFSGPLRTDKAVLGPPATIAQSDGTGDGRARVSLPASVLSALASHRALAIGPDCAGLEPDAAIAEIERRFRAFLGGATDEDAVTVQYLDEHDNETSRTYGVRLRPPREILPHPVGVVFGVEVPRQPADGG
ncbi:MAG: type VI secretion system contractile sheath large subunit, partial [Bacteroidota bacterium]